MFYVFYVNKGYMQPLEVTAALGTVRKLQSAIEETTHVPIAEQVVTSFYHPFTSSEWIELQKTIEKKANVLLVSGGDGLQSDRPVAHYQGAGTDSNPVFLFCKLSKDENQEALIPQENAELNEKSAGLLKQLRSFESISISSAVLECYGDTVQRSSEVADCAMQLCARLVQDHQLLYQGWLALVSNLDDSRAQIERRAEKFYAHYERLKAMKDKAQAILQEFDAVFETLHKITIPSALLVNSTKFEGGNKPNDECTLYEYISCADPQSSLKDIVDQVQLHLDKIDDREHTCVVTLLKQVSEQTNKQEVRDIRGINSRLIQLDTHLRSLEIQEKRLKELCTVVAQSVAAHDSSHMKEQIEEVKRIVEQFQKMAKLFSQSKIELLNNIRTRLSGWILQAYDRLHNVNYKIIVFEAKFFELRNRLDIIRQVKESPTMYVTAITEAIRRSTLHPEFHSWFTSFSEKSGELIREECSIRETFNSKLNRHFLKQLFPGMFDQFPNFIPTELPPFDQNLPPVDFSHLRALRQSVPNLAHLLKVSEPAIYQRLSVRDPRAVSVIHPQTEATASGGAPMRREESFFTSDATINITTLNKNFPSTNWLSGDENMDISPSNAVRLTKSPPTFSSTLSLDNADATVSSSKPLSPLTQLFDASQQECDTLTASSSAGVSQSVKSAPIRIPHRDDSNRQQFEMDRRSNQMTLSDTVEHLKPILNGLQSISDHSMMTGTCSVVIIIVIIQAMKTTKEMIADDRLNMEKEINKANDCVVKMMEELERSRRSALEKQIEETRKTAIAETTAHFERIIEELKAKLEDGMRRDRELVDLKEVLEDQQAEINALRTENEKNQEAIAKSENEKSELIKRAVVDHELEKMRIETEYCDEIKVSDKIRYQKDKEIEALRHSLHKAREARAHMQQSESEDILKNDEIRALFEKEYKAKMHLIALGMEEKKSEEITRIKKEAEYDWRLKSQKYEERIKELEQRMLRKVDEASRQAIEREERAGADEISQETCSSLNNPNASMVLQDSMMPLTESAIMIGGGEGAAGPSHSRDTSESGEATKDVASRGADRSDDDDKDSDEDIAAVNVHSAATQTRIRLKDMRVMITIQDIHEACAVLVVWSDVHNSYILFCTSPVMHFVKESCLRRMGVRPEPQIPSRRPNWLLATTTRLEFCQMRKAGNRYSLAVGTRFYRVEVEPLPLDSSSLRRRRSDDRTRGGHYESASNNDRINHV
ncbi:unnamed protein product [Anisakis simplex]|uniref:RB1-inducible coiled-coil protein 1 (inferred by orthology to a human protein) n=1 Tax=Anisakis simplex TaxID=6269 RepID=A0A0M3JSN0_ANISI|nr:unnamed protein product [Anisakis simplex]